VSRIKTLNGPRVFSSLTGLIPRTLGPFNVLILLNGWICSEFPLSFGTEIQGLFKDFQGPESCICKDQFSTEVYSMNSITAIFNIYFCDYGTVLVDKNKM